MSTEQLAKTEWRPYFDRLSKALTAKQAEIEVSSLMLGNQIEAGWIPLLGITYDSGDDVLEVFLEGLDHRIQHPQTVFVEQDGVELKSLEVIDDEDTRQIIRLRDSVLLPH